MTDKPFQCLPGDVELTLYRVGQEALTNVVKHAEASLVQLRLRRNAQGAIALLIVDNGCGLQRSRPLTGSLGLTTYAGYRRQMGAAQQSRPRRCRSGILSSSHHRDKRCHNKKRDRDS